MSTARDLISSSLRLIGVLASGETPSANEANDALSVLNDMLDNWSTHSLMIYSKIIETFPLTANQQTYTMGVGGGFNTARAQRIERAAIQQVTNNPTNEIPLDLINLDQWASISVKNVTSSIPLRLYPDGANPLENLSLWPIPTVANNLVLYSWKPLSSIATLDTAIVLPPGGSKMVRFNLACDLAPEFGKQIPQDVALTAGETKSDFKRMNQKMIFMSTDPAIVAQNKTFNWITGE